MRTRTAALLALALVSCGEKSSTGTPGTPGSTVAQVALATAQAGASTTIAVGQTLSLSGVAKDGSGQTISGANFTWASTNTAVATVASGTVTGVSAGTAGITASSGGVTSAPLTVTVTAATGGNGTTIGPGGGTVTLTGIATVTFPAGAFAAPQDVVVSSTSDVQTAQDFSESAAIFGPAARLPYEVRIDTGSVLPAQPVQVALAVPSSLTVPAGQHLEAFAQFWENNELDTYDHFELIPSTLDAASTAVILSLQPAAFTDQRRSDHTFEAIVTLAPTPGNAGHALLGGPAEFSADTTVVGCFSSFQPPLDSDAITSPFDPNRKVVVNGVTYTGHWGTDLVAGSGTRIRAVGDGKVTQAILSGNGKTSFGNTVVLQVAGVGAVRYAHLQSYSVRAGDHVLAGQQIGLTDNTGLSTGPHLHFELAPDGNIASNKSKVDPAPCINPKPLTWSLGARSVLHVQSTGPDNFTSTTTLKANATFLVTDTSAGGLSTALTGGTLEVTFEGSYDKAADDHCTFEFSPTSYPLVAAPQGQLPADGQTIGTLGLARNAQVQPDTQYIPTGFLYTNVSPTYVEHCAQSGDSTHGVGVTGNPWFNQQTTNFTFDPLDASSSGTLTVTQVAGPETLTTTYDWTLSKTY